MDSKGKIIIIKADNCPHCRRLKGKIVPLANDLKKIGLEMEVYTLATMGNKKILGVEDNVYPFINREYPSGIFTKQNPSDLPDWFPFLFYVKTEDWEMIKSGTCKDPLIKIHPLNGSFVNGKWEIQTAKYDIKFDDIKKWLDIIQKDRPLKLLSSNYENEHKSNTPSINLNYRRKFGQSLNTLYIPNK